ncbi:MAG: flagellar hook assembly protein FlgD [Deltaproteobacteria bacterium]|jgi:flagellar basal-body rod modification protein FlgD|nr:flagellar hook assembly protein FlgD [Deltaproteobacteria bacterium]HOF73181.1 flagellar hook assembly protein FlgD [Syntrophales bacterium]HOR31228.1 flagellar hook assembly protein FlgD [Syntrophales bacterium]HOR32734.1 flagellar hook assembly protein FlgD [Syntrophales bacterium]HPK18023.1 flagellar hook assembly protein FlgD [Syntrophales bacterium]
MSVTNTVQSAAGAASATPTTSGRNVIGKDEFLKMLIAQLKNQDPLNPLDGTAFTAQLAQFSSLEQLQNINTQLGSFTRQQQSLSGSQAVSLIGKEVLARGNTVQAAGSPVALSYQLAGDAAEGMVRIYNAAGEFVDALSFRNQKQGLNTLTWSPPSSLSGVCTYEVIATDRAGRAVGADTLVQGEVTGVNYRDGAVTLSVGGREIAYGDVVSVKKINTN